MIRVAADVQCERCSRHLCALSTRAVHRLFETPPVLSPQDFCRWCARPISETAEKMAPLEGFIAAVQRWLVTR